MRSRPQIKTADSREVCHVRRSSFTISWCVLIRAAIPNADAAAFYFSICATPNLICCKQKIMKIETIEYIIPFKKKRIEMSAAVAHIRNNSPKSNGFYFVFFFFWFVVVFFQLKVFCSYSQLRARSLSSSPFYFSLIDSK